MKKVKNAKVGQLVEIPVYEFDGRRRSGYNGWIFRAGIIEKLYISTTGQKCAKVRFCSRTAGMYQLFPCTETTKNVFLRDVFEYEGLDRAQQRYTEFVEYEKNGKQVCWDENTAFLLNNGFIK